MNPSHVIKLNIRTNEFLASPNCVVEQAEDNNTSVHHARIVHSNSVGRERRREEGEYYCDEGIDRGEDVDRKPKSTKIPRSKVDSFAAQSFSDHQDNRNEVR